MLSVPTLWLVFVVNFTALGLIWTYVARSYPNFPAAPFWTACLVRRMASLTEQAPVPGISLSAGIPALIRPSVRAIRSSVLSEAASEFVPKTASPAPLSSSHRQ